MYPFSVVIYARPNSKLGAPEYPEFLLFRVSVKYVSTPTSFFEANKSTTETQLPMWLDTHIPRLVQASSSPEAHVCDAVATKPELDRWPSLMCSASWKVGHVRALILVIVIVFISKSGGALVISHITHQRIISISVHLRQSPFARVPLMLPLLVQVVLITTSPVVQVVVLHILWSYHEIDR